LFFQGSQPTLRTSDDLDVALQDVLHKTQNHMEKFHLEVLRTVMQQVKTFL